jgi:DNA-binding transcriptional regulator YiaG
MIQSGEARDIRRQARISYPELARSLGTCPSTVWNWEHARKMPKPANAAKYLAALEELRATLAELIT